MTFSKYTNNHFSFILLTKFNSDEKVKLGAKYIMIQSENIHVSSKLRNSWIETLIFT